MHDSVMVWVKEMVDRFDIAENYVLEIGGYNENGTVRDFFTGPYLCTDMREGPGIDLILDAHDMSCFPDERFDVVISTEMLEHDSAFWLTVAEVARVLIPGGTFIVTARGIGFDHYHPFPLDCYRFTTTAMQLLLERYGFEVHENQEDPEQSGVFTIATKREKHVATFEVIVEDMLGKMDSVEVKTTGQLIDELGILNIRIWFLIDKLHAGTASVEDAKAVQIHNATRNKLVRAIDRRLGGRDIGGKMYG